jgi:hypothetical protein
LRITRRANDKEERGRWVEIFKALYNALNPNGPKAFTHKSLGPGYTLIKMTT